MAARRRAAINHCRSAVRADAVLITCPADVRYLSGFAGEDSFLLVGPSRSTLITDGRYAEQASAECAGVDVHVRDGSIVAAGAALAGEAGVRRLAVQADHMTLQIRAALAEKFSPRKIVETSGVTAARRAVKDAGEIRAVGRAVRAAERAMRKLLSGGAAALVGRSERAVAAELDYLMRMAGADGAAFETVVACGPHGSLPHYRPASTVIRHGQPVLIDWGARVAGYCSDLTRVVFVGRIPPKMAEVYEVVLRAQQAGIAAIRPGVCCRTVDAAARKVIADAGFEDEFTHGLGHGIGLEIHEGPALARGSGTRLRIGMTVTVEPGIYLPGVGGVRIEDDILVSPKGCRRLSSLPRQLAAMLMR